MYYSKIILKKDAKRLKRLSSLFIKKHRLDNGIDSAKDNDSPCLF